jgi:hypothetical protein
MTYTSGFDQLVKAVNSVEILWPNMTIVDNSVNKSIKNKFPSIDVIETDIIITCSQSFNIAQSIARKHNADVLIMMHSDIEVTDSNELKRFLSVLDNMIKKEKHNSWAVFWTHYDSLAAFNMDTCDVIGFWDQNITHYPIDIDYYYRFRKYGFQCLDFGGNWVEHYASNTIRNNPVMEYVNFIHNTPCNESYYQKKWGGSRDQERFSFPFNGYDLNSAYLKMTNNSIYHSLLNSNGSTEGGFLYGYSSENSRLAQHTLMINILKAVKPKRILEIGTHKYLFFYFLSHFIDNFELDTYDHSKTCKKSLNIINDLSGSKVNFIFGDTIKTLPKCKKEFDLAWVDGGHEYDTALSDLTNIGKLKVPYILVDDARIDSVNRAIVEFLKVNKKYYEIRNPFWEYDERGIIVLRRRR